MRYFFSLVFAFMTAIGFAQQAPAKQEPPYKRFPTVPPFELLQADSTTFTKAGLKKQATMIMYFSPSCDHCIHQIEDMEKRWKEFSSYQLVLATYQPMEELVEFIGKYKMKEQHNIKLGRDTQFMLPGFFVIKSLPYFAVYDKKGDLVTTFEGNVKVDKLLDALKGKK
ncbi:MAG: redoxin domain-containing protein [Chitinophagaceae bacterium]|nr:redoxin domain-containing protein [Chitinophagaceae bacterium]